jgi:hypothetical protein
MSGGNSKQRRRYARELHKALSAMGIIATPDKKSPAMVTPEPFDVGKRVSTFWRSTPVWGGIGVLIGVIGAQLSQKMSFVAVWGVLFLEFINCKFFPRNRVVSLAGNLLAGIVIAALLFGMWQVTPRPKDPPSLDQQMEAFARRFPFLGSTIPPSQSVVIVKPQTPHGEMAFEGSPKLPPNGPQSEDMWPIGQPLALQMFYRNSGEVSVDVWGVSRWLYVADNS